MQPLISVLIPVYNVENYIGKCCETLFGQDYDNIEYIFVDDATPDNSVQIIKSVLESYPCRKSQVHIVTHDKNKGLSAARNTAISYASGNYLLHVDSDDFLELDAVRTLVDKAIETSADIVVFNMRHLYKNSTFEEQQKISIDKIEYLTQLITYKASVCVCGKLYKSNLFKDYGVHFVDGLNFGEDYVVTPRIVYYADNIVYLNKCLYNYVHYNEHSYTVSYKPKNIYDLVYALKLLTEFFENKVDASFDLSLSHARLQSKVKMLIAICLNCKTMWPYLSYVQNLYTNETVNISPKTYSFILYLSNKKMNTIMYYYIRLSFVIKQCIKKIIVC